jgi:hypothetical protein
VRPDGYIAYYAKPVSAESLLTYFKTIFIRK